MKAVNLAGACAFIGVFGIVFGIVFADGSIKRNPTLEDYIVDSIPTVSIVFGFGLLIVGFIIHSKFTGKQ